MGFSITCETHRDWIHGQVGGTLYRGGIDLNYEASTGRLEGRIGGEVLGKTIEVQIDGDEVRGRVGGIVDGNALELFGEEYITGRCGTATFGFDCDLHFDAEQNRLEGRLGGAVFGMDVDFETSGDVPPLIAAAIAASVYYYRQLLDREQRE